MIMGKKQLLIVFVATFVVSFLIDWQVGDTYFRRNGTILSVDFFLKSTFLVGSCVVGGVMADSNFNVYMPLHAVVSLVVFTVVFMLALWTAMFLYAEYGDYFRHTLSEIVKEFLGKGDLGFPFVIVWISVCLCSTFVKYMMKY